MNALLYILPTLAVGLLVGYLIRRYIAKFQLSSAEERAKYLIDEARKDAESIKREAIFDTKDELLKEKSKFETETRERKAEITKLEQRNLQKEENLDIKLSDQEKREKTLLTKEKVLEQKFEDNKEAQKKFQKDLENLSGMTALEAKEMLITDLKEDAKHSANKLINKIETEAKQTAERKAKEIIVSTIQRSVPEVVSESTVSSVALPNDEMKGRIIGREGRNIRAIEVLTGVDVIIDDTPEAVVISCFDPVRREVAKISLERLITDGRIHPAMIEEIVGKVKREINQIIIEEGEKVVFDLGVHGMHPDLVKHLGRLKYRTSYAQNVLYHSKTVANVCGILAGEIGGNVNLAIRGGLLHDIGKGSDVEGGGGHALVGAEMARLAGETPEVVNMIASHHGDKEPTSIEAILVAAGDAISAARPGARKETMESYIKRLENLEAISNSFPGVEKSFAIQAGRELRVMVQNDIVNDDEAKVLAREISKKIEDELKYPGVIKVSVIRETRVVEYAS